ncbi:hypothetical protein MRX96_025755 [Rhipicephalus microplus]
MKSDLCLLYSANAWPLLSTTFQYIFFSAFHNKYCSGFIVHPRLLESRDQEGQLILHVHDGLTLTLEKSSILAKNLQFVSSSSAQFHTESRGMLTRNLRITPTGLSSRSGIESRAHKVEEIAAPSSEEDDGRRIQAPVQACDPKDFSSQPVNPNLTDEFVVEVCMVTSVSYYTTFNSTKDLVQYAATMLNAVQLRYTQMENPKILFQLNRLDVVELNGEELERKLYHDTIHQSSLIIDQVPRGGVQVRGILTSNFRIAPSGVTSRSGVQHYEHEVSEIVQPSSKEGHGDRTEGSDCDPKDFSSRTVNWNLTGKFVVEICMVTSTSYYRKFDSTYDFIEYMGAMLNGVQLRYADIKDPQILFQLNHLYVVKDEHLLGRKTCPGTDGEEEQGDNSGVCGYDIKSTLNKTTEYLNGCVTTNCDLVYVVISDDLTYMNNGSLSTDVEGIAEIGGICSEANVALGEDKPRLFSGIITMAHEIGHL